MLNGCAKFEFNDNNVILWTVGELRPDLLFAMSETDEFPPDSILAVHELRPEQLPLIIFTTIPCPSCKPP